MNCLAALSCFSGNYFNIKSNKYDLFVEILKNKQASGIDKNELIGNHGEGSGKEAAPENNVDADRLCDSTISFIQACPILLKPDRPQYHS